MKPALAIVLPVLDEAPTLAQRLQALQPFRQRGARVVVVDGGSQDDTLVIARAQADLVLLAPRGRAAQMNAGAAACPADVLLFLHADTALPAHADALVRRAALGPHGWGRFDVRIDSPRRLLRVVGALMNLRSRVTGIATGDQAIFVRRELFQKVGGFPDLPLMEDIALSRRLKGHGRPACLRERVTTSARRWEQHGVWRTIFLMWRLRAAYFLGADPRTLAIRYGYRPR
jgi:rSAM/selenodomain-associated transferase 2